MFYTCINTALGKHALMKEKRIKRDHQPNWFSTVIKVAIRERNHCKSKGDHDRYKLLRNKTASLIEKSINANFSMRQSRKIKIPKLFGKI